MSELPGHIRFIDPGCLEMDCAISEVTNKLQVVQSLKVIMLTPEELAAYITEREKVAFEAGQHSFSLISHAPEIPKTFEEWKAGQK